MPELEVVIGSDIDKLKKGIKQSVDALVIFGDKVNDINGDLKKNAIEIAKVEKEIKDLNKALKDGAISEEQYDKGLKDITQTQKRLDAVNKQLNRELIKTNKSMNTLSNKGLRNIKRSGADGTTAMTEFSRIVQDAPFGIRGMANNIQQLVSVFGQLQRKTGSSTLAFKAMLGSLVGPGGILLAVSAVTAGMVFFADSFTFGKKAVDILKKSQDKLTKSLEDYVFMLDLVAKTELEGAKSSTRELVNLKLLKEQLDDTALSNEKRLKAFKELQKRYPNYLKDINKDVALSKSLGDQYEKLRVEIEDKAKAEAAAKVIVEKTNVLLILQNKLTVKRRKVIDELSQQANEEERIGKLLLKSSQGLNQLSILQGVHKKRALDLTKEEDKILKDILKTQKEISTLSEQVSLRGGIVPLDRGKTTKPKKTKETTEIDVAISEVKKTIAKLSNVFADTDFGLSGRLTILAQQFTAESNLIDTEFSKREKDAKGNANALLVIENDKQTALLNLRRKFNLLGQKEASAEVKRELDRIKTDTTLETNQKINELILQYQKLGDLTSNQEKTFRNEKSKLQTDGNNQYLLQQNAYLNTLLESERASGQFRLEVERQIQSNLALIKTDAGLKLLDIDSKFQKILENGLSNALAGFGQAIGEGLANNSNILDKVGASLLGSLGGILIDLGKMALTIGFGLEAVQAALESLRPELAIAAGVGLIALGSFFKSESKSIGSSIGGGGGSGTSSASGSGGGTQRFSSSTSSSGSFGGSGRVVFEIAGTKLVGVLSNTLNRNKSLGGSLSLS